MLKLTNDNVWSIFVKANTVTEINTLTESPKPDKLDKLDEIEKDLTSLRVTGYIFPALNNEATPISVTWKILQYLKEMKA